MRIRESTSSADTRVSAVGGEEVLQVTEKRFPCSSWRDGSEQLPTLQPRKDSMLEHVGMS